MAHLICVYSIYTCTVTPVYTFYVCTNVLKIMHTSLHILYIYSSIQSRSLYQHLVKKLCGLNVNTINCVSICMYVHVSIVCVRMYENDYLTFTILLTVLAYVHVSIVCVCMYKNDYLTFTIFCSFSRGMQASLL